jgi:hypothetical protein
MFFTAAMMLVLSGVRTRIGTIHCIKYHTSLETPSHFHSIGFSPGTLIAKLVAFIINYLETI